LTRRRSRRRLLGILAAALVAAGVLAGLWARSALLLPAGGTGRPVLVDVRPGMRLKDIAALLRQEGVIRSPLGFQLLARRAGLGRVLKAGTYALNPAMTPAQVLQRLAAGDVAAVRVTIPEGYTARQVVAALVAAGIGDGAALVQAIDQPAQLQAAGLPAPAPGVRTALEGYLYPATYSFPPDASTADVIAAMLRQFAAVWTPQLAAAARSNAGLDTAQAVTLASIVQREVSAPADMALVAGVYLHRLQVGMKLDADPTVLYGLGVDAQAGPLTSDQLALDSPYNTYQVVGLPPGPICNPGAAALEAVAHPTATSALYFLTAPSGQVVLADTLAEQLANRKKYLGY
jgi:UPF0755 protein